MGVEEVEEKEKEEQSQRNPQDKEAGAEREIKFSNWVAPCQTFLDLSFDTLSPGIDKKPISVSLCLLRMLTASVG